MGNKQVICKGVMSKSVLFYLKKNDNPIRSVLSHIVTYTISCPGWLIRIIIVQDNNFTRFQSWAHKPIVNGFHAPVYLAEGSRMIYGILKPQPSQPPPHYEYILLPNKYHVCSCHFSPQLSCHDTCHTCDSMGLTLTFARVEISLKGELKTHCDTLLKAQSL